MRGQFSQIGPAQYQYKAREMPGLATQDLKSPMIHQRVQLLLGGVEVLEVRRTDQVDLVNMSVVINMMRILYWDIPSVTMAC